MMFFFLDSTQPAPVAMDEVELEQWLRLQSFSFGIYSLCAGLAMDSIGSLYM